MDKGLGPYGNRDHMITGMLCQRARGSNLQRERKKEREKVLCQRARGSNLQREREKERKKEREREKVLLLERVRYVREHGGRTCGVRERERKKERKKEREREKVLCQRAQGFEPGTSKSAPFTPTTKLSGGTISTEFNVAFYIHKSKKNAPTLRDKDEEGRTNKKIKNKGIGCDKLW